MISYLSIELPFLVQCVCDIGKGTGDGSEPICHAELSDMPTGGEPRNLHKPPQLFSAKNPCSISIQPNNLNPVALLK